MADKPSSKCYQLKITLARSRPPIWRRLILPGDLRLDELHDVIQIAMPWEDAHLHQFILKTEKSAKEEVMKRMRAGEWFSAAWRDGLRYLSHPAFQMDEVEDETKVRLAEIAPERRAKFRYEYDMGDSWDHEVLVEKIIDAEPGTTCHPHCTGGERACPPEDCGGIWGYYRMLEILDDADDPEHEDMKEWLGEEFDPEQFDIDEVNRELGKLKRRGAGRKSSGGR